MLQEFKVLISGSYNAFKEGFDACGTYMVSGLYQSSSFDLPIYIGSSKSLKKRIQGSCGHLDDLSKNIHDNSPLQCAWNIHNLNDGFVWFMLEESTLENQYGNEQKWLDKYDAFLDNRGGFNINRSATRPPINNSKGRTVSLETRLKLSKAHKGKKLKEETKIKIASSMTGEGNPFYGKAHTNEAKRAMSKAHTGKIISKEHARKISESNKGKIVSEITREKLSKAAKGHKRNLGKKLPFGQPGPQSKPFKLISPEGKLIEGMGVHNFARLHGLTSQGLYQVLKGKQTHHKGWTLPKENTSQIESIDVKEDNNLK